VQLPTLLFFRCSYTTDDFPSATGAFPTLLESLLLLVALRLLASLLLLVSLLLLASLLLLMYSTCCC
jgi:hypothetical protein